MASETDAAGPNSEVSRIVFPNKTMTSKFLTVPPFNSKAGNTLTDSLGNSRTISAFLIWSLALFVLATTYTVSIPCACCRSFDSSSRTVPELTTRSHPFSIAHRNIVLETS
jgi:hypothetical protein